MSWLLFPRQPSIESNRHWILSTWVWSCLNIHSFPLFSNLARIMSGTWLMHVYLAEMPPRLFRLPPTQMYENMNTGCLIRNDKHLFAHCYAEIELLKALSRLSQTFVRRWSSTKCHVNPLSVFRIMISILPNVRDNQDKLPFFHERASRIFGFFSLSLHLYLCLSVRRLYTPQPNPANF